MTSLGKINKYDHDDFQKSNESGNQSLFGDIKKLLVTVTFSFGPVKKDSLIVRFW